MKKKCLLFIAPLLLPLYNQPHWQPRKTTLAVAAISGIVGYYAPVLIKKAQYYLTHPSIEQPQPKKQIIAELSLTGFINDASKLARTLHYCLKEDTINGVIVHVNSGGGNGGSSDLIRQEITHLAQHKPVVVYIENGCCSGAYLSVVPATTIIATDASAIGSIGIYTKYEKLHPEKYVDRHTGEKGSKKVTLLETHRRKTLLDPYSEDLTTQEQEELQENLMKAYTWFCKIVAQYRHLSIKDANIWGEGNIFTGQEAVELGLINQIGGYSTAVQEMQKLLEEKEKKAVKLEIKEIKP